MLSLSKIRSQQEQELLIKTKAEIKGIKSRNPLQGQNATLMILVDRESN